MSIRYLTLSELIYINGTLLNRQDIATGKQQIREIELLEAAAARPAASAFGADAYPTLREKAAALMHSIARNHPFTDGNKRTATVGALFMLRVNGQGVVWQQTEALEQVVALAENRVGLAQMAEWLPLQDGLPPMPEPDADADMRAISEIIQEQRWLLHALETR